MSAQRLATGMKRLHDSGGLPQREGEADTHYFRRLRDAVVGVERARRVAKRRAAHRARIVNQKAARAARKKKR